MIHVILLAAFVLCVLAVPLGYAVQWLSRLRRDAKLWREHQALCMALDAVVYTTRPIYRHDSDAATRLH